MKPSHSIRLAPAKAPRAADPAELPMPVRAAVVYDGVPAALRAMSMLGRVVEDADGPVALQPNLWRFDMLADPRCRGRALRDALAADLLVLATASAEVLPPESETWIAEFLARRGDRAIAIVTLCGRENECTFSEC